MGYTLITDYDPDKDHGYDTTSGYTSYYIDTEYIKNLTTPELYNYEIFEKCVENTIYNVCEYHTDNFIDVHMWKKKCLQQKAEYDLLNNKYYLITDVDAGTKIYVQYLVKAEDFEVSRDPETDYKLFISAFEFPEDTSGYQVIGTRVFFNWDNKVLGNDND